MNVRILLLVAATAFAAACASQKAATEGEGTATAEAEQPLVTPDQVAWKDMTKEQKGHYMKKVVMPKMRELFASVDEKEFGDMKCSACHGKDAKERNFEMPSNDLPELPATKEGFEELAHKKPEAVKFMAEQVKPQMAKLLGLPEFDPANPQAGGFGCGDCHKMKH